MCSFVTLEKHSEESKTTNIFKYFGYVISNAFYIIKVNKCDIFKIYKEQLPYLKYIKNDITRKLAKLSTCLEIIKQHNK